MEQAECPRFRKFFQNLDFIHLEANSKPESRVIEPLIVTAKVRLQTKGTCLFPIELSPSSPAPL